MDPKETDRAHSSAGLQPITAPSSEAQDAQGQETTQAQDPLLLPSGWAMSLMCLCHVLEAKTKATKEKAQHWPRAVCNCGGCKCLECGANLIEQTSYICLKLNTTRSNDIVCNKCIENHVTMCSLEG